MKSSQTLENITEKNFLERAKGLIPNKHELLEEDKLYGKIWGSFLNLFPEEKQGLLSELIFGKKEPRLYSAEDIARVLAGSKLVDSQEEGLKFIQPYLDIGGVSFGRYHIGFYKRQNVYGQTMYEIGGAYCRSITTALGP